MPDTPVPVSSPLPEPQAESDTTVAVMTKMLVAVVIGPKVSPLLEKLGIPLDPVSMTVIIGGILHKVHLILQKVTGWEWL